MSALIPKPDTVEHGVDEDFAPGINFGPWLTGAQIPTVPVSFLYDKTAVAHVTPLTDPPFVVGTSVAQRIRPGVLIYGHDYRLTLKCTPSGTSDILDSVLNIVVPPTEDR